MAKPPPIPRVILAELSAGCLSLAGVEDAREWDCARLGEERHVWREVGDSSGLQVHVDLASEYEV